MKVLMETDLPLTLVKRGKVRDVYELDETRLLIVTTDRISAFDWVMPDGVPGLGKVRNELSVFWFRHLENWRSIWNIRHHFLTDDMMESGLSKKTVRQNDLAGRSMIVRKADAVIPVECIVRGYLAGSAFKEYTEHKTVGGYKLLSSVRENERLPHPLFTPSTKAEKGHDQNITRQECVEFLGRWQWPASQEHLGEETAGLLVELLERMSRTLYMIGCIHAGVRAGYILADTKFEFGVIDDQVVLIDEVLTPDSSRFWDKRTYQEWHDARYPKGSAYRKPYNDRNGKSRTGEEIPFDAGVSFSGTLSTNGHVEHENVRAKDVRGVPALDASDKQYLRDWLTQQGWGKNSPPPRLPQGVIEEIYRRYSEVYERLTSPAKRRG